MLAVGQLTHFADGDGGLVDSLVAIGNRAYFSAVEYVGDEGSFNSIYASDGSTASRLIGSEASLLQPNTIKAVGDELYFSNENTETSQIWKTDGTDSGTTMVWSTGGSEL